MGEQARAALSADDYGRQAQELSKSQDGLKRARGQGHRADSASCPMPRASLPMRSTCWARSPA